MDDRTALLANVLSAPADDTARPVLADWLEEHGEDDFGRFVRAGVSVAQFQARDRLDDPSYYDLLCDDSDVTLAGPVPSADSHRAGALTTGDRGSVLSQSHRIAHNLHHLLSPGATAMGFRNLLVKAGLAVGKAAAKFDPTGIASTLLDAYSKHEEKKQLRSELEEMISAGFDKFRGEVKEAMGELKQQLPDNTRAQVEAFLSQFQSSAKQAARALGDPSATTVPATVAVDDPEQLAAFLPQRPPRFVVGNSVPGLPSWKLVEPLGAGGFGEVWKAEHPYSGTAAFKFFLDPTARARFTHTEAANLAEIFRRAPTDGVVKLLNAEPGQDPPWLQFEYIGGGDLSCLPERWKGVPVGDRVRQADRVIRALAKTAGHFHSLGVVHRDLKPSNVLLRKSETGYKLVIADFGISKLVPTGGSTLPTPANSGAATIRAYTALYASPQQKKFQPADRRDDVYALGVLWYQLLRADLNLERPSGEGWKRALKNLGVSDATVALLNRCWDDEPDERPADGNALLDAIRQLDPRPVQAPVPVVPTPQPTAAAVPVPIVPAPPPIPTPPPLPDVRREFSPPAPAGVAHEVRAPAPAPGAPVDETPTAEPGSELTVEEAVRQFENAGGHRGATATAGHKLYEAASRLRFVPCRCSWDDEEYGAHEFVARNARGTCYYVSHNLGTGKVTIGSNGYHGRNPDVAECVPGSPAGKITSGGRGRLGKRLGEWDVSLQASWWFKSRDSVVEDWRLVPGDGDRIVAHDGEVYCLMFDAGIRGGGLDGLGSLYAMENLYKLSLEHSPELTRTDFANLAGLRSLRHLSARGSSVDDEALRSFTGLSALITLSLAECRVTDAGLTHLRGLTNLESLDVSDTEVTRKGVEALQRALPNCDIVWE